jgi:hypothetical protein
LKTGAQRFFTDDYLPFAALRELDFGSFVLRSIVRNSTAFPYVSLL